MAAQCHILLRLLPDVLNVNAAAAAGGHDKG